MRCNIQYTDADGTKVNRDYNALKDAYPKIYWVLSDSPVNNILLTRIDGKRYNCFMYRGRVYKSPAGFSGAQ